MADITTQYRSQQTFEGGSWTQGIDEVVLTIILPPNTRGRDLDVTITASTLDVKMRKGNCLGLPLHGPLFASIDSSASNWTVLDGVLMVSLHKAVRDASRCWPSVYRDGRLATESMVLDGMQRTMTLERYQRECPGFDFSNADVSGNYQQGGHQAP